MTSPHPTLKSVSLRLHISDRSLTWAVVYRTSKGAEVFDRRVSAGTIQGAPALVGPLSVCEALERATAEMRARYGLPPAAGGPGAPGGVGGRLGPSQQDLLPTVPLSVVRDDP